MATTTGKVTGIVERAMLKKTYEEYYIEWSIPDITTINEVESSDFYYESPPFIMADVSCCLKLYPISELNNHFMRLLIVNVSTNEEENLPEFNISLKKLDGSLEHVVSGTVKMVVNKSGFDMGNIIRRSELLRRKSVLAPHHVLTLVCKLKCELSDSTDPSDKALSLQLIRLDKLSENFKDLFGDKETCDVTLKVKDKEYKAHRCVLIARSSVFAGNFNYDTLERQTGVITIPDCDPDSFQKFLEYLYCGRLEDLSSHSAQSLYYASDKYDVEELKAFCVEYLMQCLTVENICEVVVFADKYEETELFSAVQEFFNKNVCAILESPEWECLLQNDYRLANKLMLQMAKMKFKA